MKQLCDITRLYSDPKLLAGAFHDPRTLSAWFAFMKAFFGLPLTDDELVIYRECTDRTEAPTSCPKKEAWLVCGRRAGKSRALAFISIFLSCFCEWPGLVAGERPVLLVVATDKRQARIIFRYIHGMLLMVPELAAMILRETLDTIELANGIAIEVQACNFRSLRGSTLIAALFDEAAFWRNEDSSNPDYEILTAVRPSLATTGGPLLVASSPYSKRGILWDAFRRHYGHAGDILVWRAETRKMNPTVPQSIIDEAMEADASAAQAEWLARFRDDLEAYISRELIDNVTLHGVREIPPQPHVRYAGFVDAAGGSGGGRGGGDSMACAVAHFDHKDSCTILDAVREIRPPFSPESVTEEFCRLFKTYRIAQAHADKWGSGFVVEAFQRYGVQLVPAEQSKSTLYAELLPVITSARCRLIQNSRLANQLTSLERRVGRGTGKDNIDAPPGMHEDLANAVAGAIVLAQAKPLMKIHPSILDAVRAGRGGRGAHPYGQAVVHVGGVTRPTSWRGGN